MLWCALFALACGPPESDRGAYLYGNCAQCHGEQGQGIADFTVPSIAGLDAWYIEAQLQKFRDADRAGHPDDLNGQRMRPMVMTLDEEGDLGVVAEHIAAMPDPNPAATLGDGDAETGREHYVNTCARCHGEDAQGDESQGAPRLTTSDDWYLVLQLQNFRSGIRGTDPNDMRGAQMRPMAVSLPNDQAVQDVVAYIMTL